jgi:hypothetical protein
MGAWCESGEAVVHLPMLRAHAASGFGYDLSGPNCVLRWAAVPPDTSGAVDVVVHFHGFAPPGAMRLADKADRSGLDLHPGLRRPTLGLVPHGRAFVPSAAGLDGFAFPAIADRAGLARLIDEALAAFAALPGAPGGLARGRVLLTGHSGGGAALAVLLLDCADRFDAVAGAHDFDATYSTSASLSADDGWLARVLARDARAVAALGSETERALYMAQRGAGVRILYIAGSWTDPVARRTEGFITETLAALVPDPALRRWLRRYYRAQSVADPQTHHHGVIAQVFGGRLLADAAADLAPDACDSPPADDEIA